MTITSLKGQVKSPDRVSVYVDGVYSFSLLLSQCIDEKLKVGDDIREHDIERLKKLSDFGKVRQRVLSWASLRPRSEYEVKQYFKVKLRDRGIIEDDQIQIIDSLKKYGFVDDEAFVTWWLGRRTSARKSSRVLRGELTKKGIHHALIAQHLIVDDSAALMQTLKKALTRPRYRADTKKLIAHMVQKGFAYSDVRAALAVEGTLGDESGG